jgi:hypothetical protein
MEWLIPGVQHVKALKQKPVFNIAASETVQAGTEASKLEPSLIPQ